MEPISQILTAGKFVAWASRFIPRKKVSLRLQIEVRDRIFAGGAELSPGAFEDELAKLDTAQMVLGLRAFCISNVNEKMEVRSFGVTPVSRKARTKVNAYGQVLPRKLDENATQDWTLELSELIPIAGSSIEDLSMLKVEVLLGNGTWVGARLRWKREQLGKLRRFLESRPGRRVPVI